MPQETGHADIDAALAHPAVAPLANAGFPIIVMGGEPLSVRWANGAAAALFGSNDLDALNARALAGADPGAKRLHQAAAALSPGAARLERLRYSLNGRSEVLTWRCQRLPAPIDLLVACALDWEPNHEAAPLSPAGGGDASAAANVGSSEPPPPQAPRREEAPPPSPPAENRAAAGNGLRGPAEVRAELAERFPGARHLRFLWQTARDNRFTVLTGPFCDAVGCATQELIGADIADLSQRLRLDPEGRLRAALTSRATWSKIEIFWPVAGAAAALPVVLGAAPAFDRQREFDGWRGFGVVDLLRPQTSEIAPSHAGEGDLRGETPAPPPSSSEQEPESQASIPEAEPPHAAESDNDPAPEARHGGNVVALRPPFPSLVRARAFDERPSEAENGLSSSERLAFQEIARALGVRRSPADEAASAAAPPAVDSTPPAEPQEEAPAEPSLDEPAVQNGGSGAAAPLAGACALLDRSPLGLLTSRGDEALWLNHTLLQILGYDSAAQFQEAGGLARMLRGRALQELAQTATIGETPAIDHAGNVLILECASHDVEWESEPAILTIFRRIGDRVDVARVKTLEMELRRRDAEARELHSVLDTATDGVAMLDEHGRLLSLNRAGEALFGYDQNEVAGEPFTVLLSNESHAPALDYFSQLATNGVASLLNDGREIIGRARRGGSIPVFMTLGRVNVGATQKFCAVLRDMTAWKKVERDLNEAKREAERASALKSDFLAKVSHEIRTPLNAILGFAEVIMDERFGPVGNDRYKDYLKDIHASGAHVMSLVNDLLDLSKIEAGKMELNFGSVDANKIVAECVSIMQPQANSERVIVRLSTTPRLPNVMADERSLRQIVLNLLSNAVKFNEPGGQVIVSTALTDAGHAVIRIRDTGIGMSDSELVTALEPFRQVQTSRQTSGTGLGLPLTKALVEANRASFTVKSKKSEGTLVEVAFPASRVMAD